MKKEKMKKKKKKEAEEEDEEGKGKGKEEEKEEEIMTNWWLFPKKLITRAPLQSRNKISGLF